MNGLLPTKDEWLKALRYGMIAGIFAFVAIHLKALLLALLPFALAFAISLLLEPVVDVLAIRLHLGRTWATLIVLGVLSLAGGLFLTWATTLLVDAINSFIDAFPRYKETVDRFIRDIAEEANQAYGNLPPQVIEYIAKNTSRVGEAVEGILTGIGRTILSLLTAVPGILTAGLTASLFVLLATFFTSKDLPRVKALLWRLVPRGDQPKVRSLLTDLTRVALRYLRAQALLIGITTLLTTLGLLLAGVENWLTAGLVIGLLDLLPVVGPSLVFIPWIVYLLIVGQMSSAIGLLVVYAAASIGRTLVEAKVIGDSVGLHPLATLIALYSGALLWGVPGALLGPAILLVVKAVLKAWRSVDAR